MKIPYDPEEGTRKSSPLKIWRRLEKKSATQNFCDNYYPFGLTFNSFTRSYSTPQKYKFGGKEEQEEWGVLDFEARMYDAAIGRFMTVDPMAESRNWLTPYNYVQNNPLLKIDPTGMIDIFYINKDGSIEVFEQEGAHEYYMQTSAGETGSYAEDYTLVATLDENADGMVEFPSNGEGYGRYGTDDAGGQSTNPTEDVGSGDHFVTPETAAALFGVLNSTNEDGLNIDLGDMSSSNGSDPWQPGFIHHAGHGHLGNRSGLDVDFRYLNSNGNSFQSNNAFNSSSFSATNNQNVFDTAETFGFTVNYQGTSGSLTGVPQASGHNDHGHIGRAANNTNVTTINTRKPILVGPPTPAYLRTF